jgi:hypothetical protein
VNAPGVSTFSEKKSTWMHGIGMDARYRHGCTVSAWMHGIGGADAFVQMRRDKPA